jgi:hypothetical protein
MYLMFMNYLKEEMHQVPEDMADAKNQRERKARAKKEAREEKGRVCVLRYRIVDRVRYPALRTFRLEVDI